MNHFDDDEENDWNQTSDVDDEQGYQALLDPDDDKCL